MTILDKDGRVLAGTPPEKCSHGVTFDLEEAKKILGSWKPKDAAEFVAGNPATREIRRRWLRLDGQCPKGCGFNGIAYASMEHYTYGDW